MSYEISYRRQVLIMSAARAGHYDDLLFLLEECGSNNCWELDNRRRSRDWHCLAAGAEHDCLAEAVRLAAACCGGSLVLYGRRRTKPEAYISAWRRAIAEAAPIDEAPRLRFSLGLYARISDTAAEDRRKYAFERLRDQTLVSSRRDTDTFTGTAFTEWRFDPRNPDQVRLWLDTRETGRVRNTVEVNGPG